MKPTKKKEEGKRGTNRYKEGKSELYCEEQEKGEDLFTMGQSLEP